MHLTIIDRLHSQFINFLNSGFFLYKKLTPYATIRYMYMAKILSIERKKKQQIIDPPSLQQTSANYIRSFIKVKIKNAKIGMKYMYTDNEKSSNFFNFHRKG